MMLNVLEAHYKQTANMPKCLEVLGVLSTLKANAVYSQKLVYQTLGCTSKPVGHAMAILTALGIVNRLSPRNHNQPAEFSINEPQLEYALSIRLWHKDGKFICSKCGQIKHVEERSSYANYKCVCATCMLSIQKIHLDYQRAYKKAPKSSNLDELFKDLANQEMVNLEYDVGAKGRRGWYA